MMQFKVIYLFIFFARESKTKQDIHGVHTRDSLPLIPSYKNSKSLSEPGNGDLSTYQSRKRNEMQDPSSDTKERRADKSASGSCTFCSPLLESTSRAHMLRDSGIDTASYSYRPAGSGGHDQGCLCDAPLQGPPASTQMREATLMSVESLKMTQPGKFLKDTALNRRSKSLSDIDYGNGSMLMKDQGEYSDQESDSETRTSSQRTREQASSRDSKVLSTAL